MSETARRKVVEIQTLQVIRAHTCYHVGVATFLNPFTYVRTYVCVCVCDNVEVHYCVATMQWKFMSFKRSINFNRIQNVSIRGSSSAAIQNLGKRGHPYLMLRFPKFCITADEDPRIETFCSLLKSILRLKLVNFHCNVSVCCHSTCLSSFLPHSVWLSHTSPQNAPPVG